MMTFLKFLSYLAAFLAGGFASHTLWTGGVMAVIEARWSRARSQAMEQWRKERGSLKDDLGKLHIRLLGLEKRVSGSPAKAAKK